MMRVPFLQDEEVGVNSVKGPAVPLNARGASALALSVFYASVVAALDHGNGWWGMCPVNYM